MAKTPEVGSDPGAGDLIASAALSSRRIDVRYIRNIGALTLAALALLRRLGGIRGLLDLIAMLRSEDFFGKEGARDGTRTWSGTWQEQPEGKQARTSVNPDEVEKLARHNERLTQAIEKLHDRLRAVFLLALVGFLLALISFVFILGRGV